MDLASKWQTASFILAMIVATSSTTVGAADEGNLLPDASFEEAENGQPTDWNASTWSGKGKFRHVDGGRTGEKCLMIESDAGGDLSWMTEVPVEPNSTYRMSGWIRTENLEAGTGRG